MESLLSHADSIPTLLAAICVVLAFQVLAKVAEFVWGILKKNSDHSEESIQNLTLAMQENTRAVEKLDDEIKSVKDSLSALPKMKLDLQRYYRAIRILAGDQWAEIKKEITEDELPNGNGS